jgi:V/A-type H+-transporting ATPase subunit I
MAVVKINEFTLLTFDGHRDALLKRLQEFEDVHFKNLQDGDPDGLSPDRALTGVSEFEAEIAKIRFAVNKLKPFVKKPSGLNAYMSPPPELSFEALDGYVKGYDYESVCGALKQTDDAQKNVRSEINRVNAENENLKIWSALDVSSGDTDDLQYVSCFYGVLGKTGATPFIEALDEEFPASFYEIISSGANETSVVFGVLKADAESALSELKNTGFTKSTVDLSALPAKRVGENNQKLSALYAENERLDRSVAALAGEYANLLIALDCLNTLLEREKARGNFLTTVNAVVMEGWTPGESAGELEDIVKQCCGDEYYMESREAENGDDVPVKLENSKMAAAFEGITRMYALPKYGEIDPTPHLAPFYIAFFGIMIGDVGFGLLLMAASIFVKNAPGFGKGVKEFMNMIFYCSIAVIAAGLLFGGIFGVTFFSPVRTADGFKPILDSRLDIQNMLVYSLVIGLFHIIYGLLLKAWANVKAGKILDALFDSGFWIVCVLSAAFWLVGIVGLLPAGVATLCKWLFVASVVGLACTQGRENKTIVGKVAGGLFGVYGLTSYVGDIVSYTRLVALMLSGAYIGMSFNMMAGLVAGEFSFGALSLLRILFAAVVVVVGQALNIGLSALGAYVHTCRLQYVEFFGKFYEGGGKPFTPFGVVSDTVKVRK